MELLAVDQGNSRTKLALFRDGEIAASRVIPTIKSHYAWQLAEQLAPLHLPHIPIGLCSVVPEAREAWKEIAYGLGIPLTVFTGASPTPLVNAYETPQTLGADRLLAAVAAIHLLGAPVISVSLGTATVVDAVAAGNLYLGGMIAPGIGLAAEALSAGASALSPIPWRAPARAIGRTTDDSLTAGHFYHSVGAVRTMIAAVREEVGMQAPLALTGGWAEQLAPYIDGVNLVDEYLVLRGIALLLTA